MKEISVGGIDYTVDKYGMLHQKAPVKFEYSKSYVNQQSTNLEMSYLRLGYLLAIIPYEVIRDANVLELGPGTGQFFEVMKNHVRNMEGFDVANTPYSTVNLTEVRNRKWDIVCAFDVIEHFPDINDLWKIDFRIGYFSSPSPPSNGLFPEWRHFKPNEHLTHFTAWQFRNWVNDHNYNVLACGYPEDLLRKRWNDHEVNINSYIIRKKEC